MPQLCVIHCAQPRRSGRALQARVTLVGSYVLAYFREEAMPDVPQLIFEDRQVPSG